MQIKNLLILFYLLPVYTIEKKNIHDDASHEVTLNNIKIWYEGTRIDKAPDLTASTLTVKPAPGVWDFWLLNRIRNGDASPIFVWL